MPCTLNCNQGRACNCGLVSTNPHGRQVDTEIHEAPRTFAPDFGIAGPYESAGRIWRVTRIAAAAIFIAAIALYGFL